MEDIVDIGAEALAGSGVANVAFNDAGTGPFARADFCADLIKVVLVAGGKVVESEDVLIELEKSFENV